MMNTCEDSDGISRLPEEILIKIIADLPLRDRKSTRLVCRRWFTLNNDREISNKEELCCYGCFNRSLDFILDTIAISERNTLNLRFDRCDFSVDSPRSFQFWKDYGLRIESLSFTMCKLSDQTLRHVIEYCDKMRCFAVVNPLPNLKPDGGKEDQKLFSGVALQQLIDENVRRERLSSFQLVAHDERWISNNCLRVLFDICPNIEKFSFLCHHYVEGWHFSALDISNEDLLRSNEESTFVGILKKLVDSRKRMKYINLKTKTFCQKIADLHSTLMRYDFPVLTSMESVTMKLDPLHPIYDFLPRHSQLRCVTFNLKIHPRREDKALVERLMNGLLDSCTQLQSLVLKVSADVRLSDRRIFAKIRNSNLKSLFLNFKLLVTRFGRCSNRIINNTLKKLHLTVCNHSTDMLSRQMTHVFIKTFRGLNDLTIDGAGLDDRTLQDIFFYQRQLTHLFLWDFHNVPGEDVAIRTEYGFTGTQPNGQRTGHSIKDLQKLQHLDIFDKKMKVTKKFLEELKFPNLSYLGFQLSIPPEIECQDLMRTFSNLPNLEEFAFAGDLCLPAWLEICKQLKMLRLLFWKSYFTEFSDQEYKLFFEECPTLQVLHRYKKNIFNATYFAYHHDIVRNRVWKANNPLSKLVPTKMTDVNMLFP